MSNIVLEKMNCQASALIVCLAELLGKMLTPKNSSSQQELVSRNHPPQKKNFILGIQISHEANTERIQPHQELI